MLTTGDGSFDFSFYPGIAVAHRFRAFLPCFYLGDPSLFPTTVTLLLKRQTAKLHAKVTSIRLSEYLLSLHGCLMRRRAISIFLPRKPPFSFQAANV